MAVNAGVPMLVIAFALIYAGVPSAETKTVGAEPLSEVQRIAAYAVWAAIKEAALQPLDFATCPWLGFGCRFLRLDHRTLLANSPPADVLIRLRTGRREDLSKDLAYVDGLFLRGRTLRFADFTESRLYAADLMEADLRGARLQSAQLQGANLSYAHLKGASLREAQLKGANLSWAQLQGTYFFWAQLQGADLRSTRLQGAYLAAAQLQGAYLDSAALQGASLAHAQLQGASVTWAHLQGANLFQAQLQGTFLFAAQLQGANLNGVQLQGADLRAARIWQTTVNAATNLGLADLRGASWQPPDENETARLRKIIDELPPTYALTGTERETLIAPGEQSDDLPELALDGVLLVDDVEDPHWQQLDRARLTTDERAYDEALVPFLADLARSDPHVARGLASRMEGLPMEKEQVGRADRLARGLLGRAGPALPEDVRDRLSRIESQPAPQKP